MIEIRTACSTTKGRQPRPRGWARNTAKIGGILIVLGASVLCAVSGEATEVTQSVEVQFKPFTIERKYKSMVGPRVDQEVVLFEREPPELLWLTGASVEIEGPDRTTSTEDFLCHNWFFSETPLLKRPFLLLYQGQTSIRFPEGFGIPVVSDEPFFSRARLLNVNRDDWPFQVHIKNRYTFARDRDLQGQITPLSFLHLIGHVLLEGRDGYFGVEHPDPARHGHGAGVGTHAEHADLHLEEQLTYRDAYGRTFSSHWVLPPGRHVFRSLVTNFMRVPEDTTAHYISAHVHPYAESLELVDLTVGETIYKTGVVEYEDRLGIVQVNNWSSEEGIPIYKDHEYEIVSVYHNTSPVDQDAQAVVYLYVADPTFEERTLAVR